MTEFQFPGFLSDLVHREVHDPAELIAILLHMLLAGSAQQLSQNACRLLSLQLLSCRQADKITVLQSQSGNDSLLAVLQELGNTADKFAVLIQPEPERLMCCLYLHLCTDRVDLLAGSGESVDNNCLHGLSLEGTEATVCHHVSCICQRQVNAQIGLVGAILVHCLQIRDSDKGRLGCLLIKTIFFKHRGKHLLHNGEDILLGGKCHLHVQLIELTGRTVGSRVLITEAGRDLKVAVKAGCHQYLLELLRCLRQRIELARMVSCRYEVISRTLRGRTGKNGRRDLHKAQRIHSLAKLCDDTASHDNILLHVGIAQIQITILQSGILVRIPGLVNLKGKCVVNTFSQYLDLIGNYLDLSGGQILILVGTLPDDTFHRDRGFLVNAVHDVHHVLCLNDKLCRTVKVSKDYKP